ncbi:hypothetical protein FF041_23905 [Streptomyces jumonjinensis]|uniref:Uncharacterized protein n=1 Tax=Streptomyces jumonjinensis TaxID=1945 RepID=A0A646KM07_STRJU|nr:hypothetical protein [Streptomyces jumonjinensis]
MRVVGVLPTRPTTVAEAFRAAARLIAANGHWQGDYVPDAFDREMDVPHALRPMSIVAALKCAMSGDPHRDSLLADNAIAVLAARLEVGGEVGPYRTGIFDLEEHIAAWGDAPGRSVESVVAVLEAAADATVVAL